ncbi:MAG: preprotein translocase subunit SecE [Peptococcaceae bacterium]|jgi:preprotein translocase subunit SecE|nr:preprotein translocase subunit SecE [Peptococcaceae bacterium]
MATAKAEKVRLVERVKKRFRGVTQEMKKVHWPTRRELMVYTAVVLVTCALVGSFIWIVDFGVSSLMTLMIK